MFYRIHPPEVAISHVIKLFKELEELRSLLLVLVGYRTFATTTPV